MPTQEERAVAYRNEQAFYYDIYIQDCSQLNEASIKTSAGRLQNAVKLNPEAIWQLVIEDDLLTWFHKGYIIFQDNLEGASQTQGGFKPPTFRMDARDLLIVKISPIRDNNAGLFKPEDWDLEFEFTIYDVEDVPHDNPFIKLKKFYFWDLRYQMINELHTEFSTASAQSDGTMTTGAAISALLVEANKDYDTGKISLSGWEAGTEPVFYTAPATFTTLDSLNYLLNRHVATKENDLCLFTLDRYTKEFQLIPFATVFKRAGKSDPGIYQFEHFFLQQFTDSKNIGSTEAFEEVVAVKRAPLDPTNSNYSVDIKMDKYSIITHYRFVDMAGIDNAKALTTRPVFSYDFKLGQFNCEYKDHSIVNVKDVFKTQYVEKLYGKSVTPLLTLNQSKTKFKNIEPVFSSKNTKNQRLNDGRNKTLHAAIYMNECIAFNALGATNRRAGRFIGIDRVDFSQNTNDFDDKFFGQWFITNVRHVFDRTNYRNELLGVKIHSFQDLKINEAIP